MMFKFIIRLFVKDFQNTNFSSVKLQYIRLQSVISIGINIIFSFLKLWLGLMSASLTLISDAIDSMTNVASSVILMISYKLFYTKETNKHPFGQGRILYITNFFLSMLLFLTGFELLSLSVKNLLWIQKWPHFNNLVLLVVFISIATNEWLTQFCFYIARKINSNVLRAEAIHKRTDNLFSLSVLISWVASKYGLVWVDSLGGIFFSLIIFKSAYSIAKESVDELLGKSPDPAEIVKIIEIGKSEPGVLNIHEIIVHNYGEKKIVSFHIELDENLSLKQADDICDKVEEKMKEELGYFAITHPDPVDQSNTRIVEINTTLQQILKKNKKLMRTISTIGHIRFTQQEHILKFDVFLSQSVSSIQEENMRNIFIHILKKEFTDIKKIDPQFRPLFTVSTP